MKEGRKEAASGLINSRPLIDFCDDLSCNPSSTGTKSVNIKIRIHLVMDRAGYLS
jgi:hypothetical protein